MSKLFFLLVPAALFGQGMGMHGRMMGRLPDQITAEANPLTAAKIDLGRILFYDPRFSLNRDVSCNSCHDLANYGVDGKRVSAGHQQKTGTRNSPSVYHAAGHFAQFWDGRAADVEEQAKGPVLNPVEMAMPSADDVVARIRAIPGYAPLFRAAFPDEADAISFDNFARAIGAFERKLVTPSRWDKFLAGDRSVLSSEEMKGHHEFMHSGCATCHNGPYVGGRQFQKLGTEKPWPVESDPGRFAVTRSAADRMVFKVPSLRNVEKTAPYFHDGQVATLERAVRLMGEHQLNTQLSDPQVRSITAWLGTLTGEIPGEYIRSPKLPQ
jgi:cytochrome c peroxidase